MENVLRELRLTARSLARRPVFLIVAVLSLALGIGANSAIFSLVNGILLQPLPGIDNPSDLVRIVAYREGFDWPLGTSAPAMGDIAAATEEDIAGLAGFTNTTFGLSLDGEPPEIRWGLLTLGDYWSVLGVTPELGRFFGPNEEASREPVAVISHSLWQERFAGGSDVIGREISLDGQSHTIIGVAPEGFIGTETLFANEVFVPMVAWSGDIDSLLEDRSNFYLKLTGRLRPESSLADIDGPLAVLSETLARDFPEDHRQTTFGAMPEHEARVEAGLGPAMRQITVLLLGLVGLVLLIACGNVANLMLARGMGRAREMSVRMAIGAERRSLISQMLAESLMLSLLGGVCGLGIAVVFARLAETSLAPSGIPLRIEATPDLRVLLFTLGVSVLAGLIFGIIPALRASRQDPARGLRAAPVGGNARTLRLGNAFVVVQISLSLLLLVAAGLFLRSLSKTQLIDLGIDPSGVAAISFDLDMLSKSPEEGLVFHRQLAERLREIPGVERVTPASWVPLDWSSGGFTVNMDRDIGGPSADASGNELTLLGSRVGAGYFDIVNTPLIAGRGFRESDDADSEPVVVVNEHLAEIAWPSESALGKSMRINGRDQRFTVVGVAKDGKYRLAGEAQRPYIYVPFEQMYRGAVTVLLETRGDPAKLLLPAQQAVATLEPDLAIWKAEALSQTVTERVMSPVRIMAALASSFGFLGLVLAAVGLYGIMAHVVGQRTREIGVRIALGASTGEILTRILRQGLRLAILGSVFGGLVAFAGTRLIQTFLVGVDATDPLVFGTVTACLIAVALLASLAPALRAARIDPVRTLRAE